MYNVESKILFISACNEHIREFQYTYKPT